MGDLEVRRWKAFLRLNGETLVERDEDILNEFKGFVQALKRIGVDYSIVVNIEQSGTENFSGLARPSASIAHGLSSTKRVQRVGD